MSLKNALYELLNHLDAVADKHGEIRDTMVREYLGITIDQHFIRASTADDFPLPNEYAMFSDEGDEGIYKAIGQFLNHPEVRAALAQMTPEERSDAFEDYEVRSSNGNKIGYYFGWR